MSFSTFSTDFFYKTFNLAQNLQINSNSVLIDSRFCDLIQTLNNKGYKTTFCCSGHTTKELLIIRRIFSLHSIFHRKNISHFQMDLDIFKSLKFLQKHKSGRTAYIAFDSKFAPKNFPDIKTELHEFNDKNIAVYFKMDDNSEDSLNGLAEYLSDWANSL